MEIVMELRNLRKEYFFADRLIRGCMVLAMIGMLWIGSRVHAEGYTEECKREMAVPAAVISYRENMEECGRIARDAALHVGGAAGSLAEESEREVSIARYVREGDTRENIPVISLDRGNAEEIVDVGREEISVDGTGDVGREEISMEESEDVGREEISVEETEDVGREEISMEESEDVGREEISVEEPEDAGRDEICAEDDVNADIDEASTEGNTAGDREDTDAGSLGTSELSGFLIDKDGYITGVTERVDVTDGVLIFAREEGCIGIRKGALSELVGCVWEIYIPVNICKIEPGALDEFLFTAYIEVAPDHPCYYSEDGGLHVR
ncbi:MAG: hypothetical protein HFG92_01120 [Dorea sp.]|jgi:hypothetical protein|nr:hypothetical protein [Dorea sp.]